MEVKPGDKQTEVGVIPEDWKLSTFDQVFDVTAGGDFDPKRSKYFLDEIHCYPIYSNALTNGGLYGYCSYANHSSGSITITARGTLGVANFRDHAYTAIGRVLVLRPKGDIDGRFFAEFINNRVKFAIESTGVPQLTAPQISTYKLTVPPLPEQRAIATALSDVDALISVLDRLIAKKRDLKQAAMQQLLTGKRRLNHGLNGLKDSTDLKTEKNKSVKSESSVRISDSDKGYKQTEVGIIPEEWVVKRLGDVATIRDGTHQTPKYVASGIPFFSVEHITSRDFKNTKFISEEEHRFLTRSFKIEKGDILMTRIGSIGDCKLIDWEVEASFYVSLALLKIHSHYSAAYIAHYSNSAAFKKEVELHSLQSAIPKKINLGPISNVRIKMPPLPEQIAIAAVLLDMDAEITALERRRDKTRDLKQGMMQELLTGRIRFVGKGA